MVPDLKEPDQEIEHPTQANTKLTLQIKGVEKELHEFKIIKEDNQIHKNEAGFFLKYTTKGFKIQQSKLDQYGIKYVEEAKKDH